MPTPKSSHENRDAFTIFIVSIVILAAGLGVLASVTSDHYLHFPSLVLVSVAVALVIGSGLLLILRALRGRRE
jgi:undecaprenyl pyrophosphate phosphatase UppP